MEDAHIILPGEEMYPFIDLVKAANRARGGPLPKVSEAIAIFANTQRAELGTGKGSSFSFPKSYTGYVPLRSRVNSWGGHDA